MRTTSALELADLGYHIHALRPSSKSPATANAFKDATTDTGIIRSQFQSGSNIGIALETSGIFVIGPDCAEWLATFEQRGLPDTMTAQSGSGPDHRHYYYRLPDSAPVHRYCVSGEFDIISNGYVIAPPSVTTGPYIWLTPLQAVSELPYAPAWAVEMLQAHKDKDKAKPSPTAFPARSLNESDQEVIEKIRASEVGAKFDRLYRGDLTAHDGTDYSHSGADLAFLSMLTFRTQDEAQLDRLFASSELYRSDHWKGSYKRATLKKALSRRTFHEPPRPETKIILPVHGSKNNGATEPEPTVEPEPLERLNANDQNLPRITEKSWKVLLQANDPARMFRFGSQLTRMERDEYEKPVLKPLNENRTRYELARAADWYRMSKKGKQVPAMPPVAIVRDVLALPDPPLPILQTITEIPTFSPNGILSMESGYHPESKSFYAPANGFDVPDVPEKPTPANLKRARQIIFDELLVDFPFTGKPEIAHAVGLLLLPCVRNMIAGPTPLHLIEKPSPGTGASLLVDTLSTIASGRPAAVMTEGRDEDEWRKRITATLRSSPQFIHIDNLRGRLDSAALSAVLTAEYWTDRMLGKSENVTLPIRAAWIATGNNPAMSTETARRTIRIRMDAKTDEPWNRTTFKHPKLREWALKYRAEIVWSALVMVQHWVAEGQPIGGQPLGSYENWAAVIGGILEVNNITGFLGNLSEFYESADQEGEQIRSFLRRWHEEHGSNSVMVNKDLYRLVSGDIVIDIEAKSIQGEKANLGRIIASLRDRIYRLDEFLTVRVEETGEQKRAKKWRLREINEPDF